MSSTTKNLFNHHESFEEDILVEWQDFVEVHFGPEDQILCSWLSDWFMNALSDELHDEVLQEFHDLSESKQGVATLIKLAFDKIQSNSPPLSQSSPSPTLRMKTSSKPPPGSSPSSKLSQEPTTSLNVPLATFSMEWQNPPPPNSTPYAQ
jgi:hypothetical protein